MKHTVHQWSMRGQYVLLTLLLSVGLNPAIFAMEQENKEVLDSDPDKHLKVRIERLTSLIEESKKVRAQIDAEAASESTVNAPAQDHIDLGREEAFQSRQSMASLEMTDRQLDEDDPLEAFNTKMFAFNLRVDQWVLRPIAVGYDFIMPNAAQRGISNALKNLGFISRLLNSAFQGKMGGAGREMGRFVINSTAGIAGLVEVAGPYFNLPPSDEDTGQTLAVYGVSSGPYLVLPLFPPFTVRDGFGHVVDTVLNPANLLLPLAAGGLVNERARHLDDAATLETAMLDRYSAVRNAYFQKRTAAINE